MLCGPGVWSAARPRGCEQGGGERATLFTLIYFGCRNCARSFSEAGFHGEQCQSLTAELLCPGLPQHLPRGQAFHPLGLRNLNGIAECSDYFAFAPLKIYSRGDIRCWVKGCRTSDTRRMRQSGCPESKTAALPQN